ncbi:MAG: carcinine hydrolase/isopenicillin-N N-acyltransferase family protein, partial [Rudaea sp.]
ESAVAAAMLPARASSYNNLIASADGRIVNVEGSATDCDLLWATGGATFHTNSYRSEKMKPFEVATYDPTGSETRCSRAAYYVGKYHGEIGRETCEKFLRDHVFAPWSICRHSGDSVTVFSAIIDVNEREMWLARGNPCVNPYERLALD